MLKANLTRSYHDLFHLDELGQRPQIATDPGTCSADSWFLVHHQGWMLRVGMMGCPSIFRERASSPIEPDRHSTNQNQACWSAAFSYRRNRDNQYFLLESASPTLSFRLVFRSTLEVR